MARTRTLLVGFAAASTIAATTIVGSAGAATAAGGGYTTVPGSTAAFTAHTRPLGAVAAATPLTIQVWLRPDLAAASAFAAAVSTPGNPAFGHYLSPAGYSARFGPTSAEAARVEAWLRSAGFTAVHTDAARSYVRASATTARIDAAFRTRLEHYGASASVNAGRYPLRANDRPVSVPTRLAGSVLGVTGLDNAAPLLPLDRPGDERGGARAAVRGATAALTTPCSAYYGQHQVGGLPEQFGTTTFPTPVCGYSADQIRAAYGSDTANTGTGQTIALVELGLTPDMFLTLHDYARANHMPAPSTERYAELSLGQGSACGDPFDIEEQLDVESSYDMAPGASQLVVGGDSCNQGDFGLQGLFDADIAVLNGAGGHPLASIASNSWEGGTETQPTSLTNIEHAYLVRAAAEGVGMYFSAGDGSGVLAPADDPYAVAVGGTTLGIGATNNRLFETGWSTAISLLSRHSWQLLGEQGASGGGPSLLWRQPGYQVGVVPPALAKAPGNRPGRVRSVPDISADADPFTGFAEGILTLSKSHPPRYGQIDIGGTSLAAPLVAGMVLAVQQGQAHSFGFLDPAVYKLAGTDAVFDALPLTGRSPSLYRGMVCDEALCGSPVLTTFDDQSYSMEGYTGQVTLKGYDNMTGIGTPDGPNFLPALRKVER